MLTMKGICKNRQSEKIRKLKTRSNSTQTTDYYHNGFVIEMQLSDIDWANY